MKPDELENPKERHPSLTDLLRQEIKKVCPEDPGGRTWGELLAKRRADIEMMLTENIWH